MFANQVVKTNLEVAVRSEENRDQSEVTPLTVDQLEMVGGGESMVNIG